VAVKFDRSEGPGVIRLEGEIGIADAAQLKEVLLEALRPGAGARIALEMASGLDVTAVQLLWAAERAAQASGTLLAFEGNGSGETTQPLCAKRASRGCLSRTRVRRCRAGERRDACDDRGGRRAAV
jgi:hypothetical protein